LRLPLLVFRNRLLQQTFAQWVERSWLVARAAGIKRETYERLQGHDAGPYVIGLRISANM
jgi:hypothetical protein